MFFILAFALSGGIINASGIFDRQVDMYNIDETTADIDGAAEGFKEEDNGITELDGSVHATGDLDAITGGWQLLTNSFSMLKLFVRLVFLPGPWLVAHGAPFGFAAAIQIMLNTGLVWGVIQFLSNRSTQSMS